MSSTDIWVLCAPKQASLEAQRTLSTLNLQPAWTPQPHTPGTLQARISCHLGDDQVAQLASKFGQLGIAFEIQQMSHEPCLILGHPGLGLRRLPLDSSGEAVVRMGRLESLMAEAAGSQAELRRLLRLESGTAWLDLLEPYRLATPRVRNLPRAV